MGCTEPAPGLGAHGKTLPELVAEADTHLVTLDRTFDGGFTAMRAYFEGLVTGYIATMRGIRSQQAVSSEVSHPTPRLRQLYYKGRAAGVVEAEQVIVDSKEVDARKSTS